MDWRSKNVLENSRSGPGRGVSSQPREAGPGTLLGGLTFGSPSGTRTGASIGAAACSPAAGCNIPSDAKENGIRTAVLPV